MSDRRRSPSPMAYQLSCRSSPDPAAYERYTRSDSSDFYNSCRHSCSLGDISCVGNSSGRRDSLLSCPSPRLRNYSVSPDQESGLGLRPVSSSRHSISQEDVITNHKRLSKLQQNLMAANKKIGRMEVLYEETNKRKGRLQEELLEACTKVAKLEAMCVSHQEKETSLQQEMLSYHQQNSKLELDVLSSFKKVSQLEFELDGLEEKKKGVQQDHITAQERISLLEAMVEKLKQRRSTVKSDEFTINRKISELEAMNERCMKENEELRQEVRRAKSKTFLAEDELNKSLIEKVNLSGKLNKAKEAPVERDESVDILLGELNKFKELYQNALKTNPEASDYNKLLLQLENYKEECSRLEGKLYATLEFESKYKEAKLRGEETVIEMNGAKRKLALAEEQLQKALKQKATFAMEIGKSNNKGIKNHEALMTMEKDLSYYKNMWQDSEKQTQEIDTQLQKALKERQLLVEQCKDLSMELQETDSELEQLMTASEEIKATLESVRNSALNTEQQCTKLTRNNQELKEDVEESNTALSQVRSELTRCKRQLNGYKDNVDASEHKENEGNKRVKQLMTEMEEINEQLDKKCSQATELETKLKVCQEEKENITEELYNLQDKMVAIESQLNRTEREKNGRESEREELEESVNRQRDGMKKLRQELEEQKMESEKVFRESEDEVMKAKQCFKEMEALETKYNMTAGRLSEMERKYDAVVGERQELRRDILKAESDVAQLERSLNLGNKEKAELLSEVERMSSHKNKQDSVVGKLEKELLEVRELHEQLVERNQEDQVKFKKQTQELGTALETTEAKNTQVDELVNRCEALKQERKDLRDDSLNVKEQCSRVQSQLDKELREKENLTDELNETKKKVKRRDEENENLAQKLQEQGDILEKGSRRSREEQGQMRLIKQELEVQLENSKEKCQELENVKGKFEALQQEHDGKKKEMLDAASAIGKLESKVSKLERDKTELVVEVENRGSNITKQNEGFTKLQRQLKEVKEKLASSQQQVDELQQQSKRQSDDNRALFKQLAQKNSDCVELETNLKEIQLSKNNLSRDVRKLEGKCKELEKQTETGFREKLKLTEELKASEEIQQRTTNEVNRFKEQIREYKNLYEANLKDSVYRKDGLDKKSHQYEEVHKKYSKQTIELSEVEKRLEEAKTSNSKLKKDCFMKQTKITKLEELLQKAMLENEAFNGMEKEFRDAQEDLQQRNEDIEDCEIEVQALKVRVCELEATKATLEKSNAVLKVSNESDRVQECLKKLSELEKAYQKTSLTNESLELQLKEAKSLLTESEAQAKEVGKLEEKLHRSEQELSDMEFQVSILNKENKGLKENVVRLGDKLTVLETEKVRLNEELKQVTKKSGYSRGGLLIGNEEAEVKKPRPEALSYSPVGLQTSTPLTSPRTADSRSFENKLERKYSLDSLFVTSTQRVVNGRLSTSLDNLNLERDWPRPTTLNVQSGGSMDVTRETMDTSFESMAESEISTNSSDVRTMIRQLEKPSPPGGWKGNRSSEDWETVSDISSAAWTMDEPSMLIDLEADLDEEISDTASVKSLKQQFETSVINPPAKLVRKSSNLSRTLSLTTLIENQEEITGTSDGSNKPSEVSVSPSEGAKKSPNVNTIHENDVKISDDAFLDDADTKHLDIKKENKPQISSDNSVSPYAIPTIPDVILRDSDVVLDISDSNPKVPDVTTTNPECNPNGSDVTPNTFDSISNIADVIPNVPDDSPNVSDVTPIIGVVDNRAHYNEAGLKVSPQSQPMQGETKTRYLLVVNSEIDQATETKVKVKNIKSLWEKRDNEKTEVMDSQKMKRKEKGVIGGKKNLGRVSLNTCKDSVESNSQVSSEVSGTARANGSTETAKLAKVSDLVNLFNKSN